ncbi:GAF and ANTAR domain-containing protein [Streptomyces sp. A1499]|uniref:GAF and ANTAR domain-containing protein n=1 Tax=Streptomyces sp. A1499 TaxID=2563104 RepID=UPI00109ED449|nr:GAF and ANTAR domain-containing protein [Streptomyces sp. A1499]THC55287.1 ANTAR domain-containing protein [Streptomyces sp. A1499]
MSAVPGVMTLLATASRAAQGLSALRPAQFAAALDLDGLVISLINGSGLELVWSDPSDTTGKAVEDLQYTLGEGPSLDAARTGEPVLVPDLRAVPAQRWPALLPPLLGHPVRALYVLPLQLGAIRLGVLTGRRARPGPLTRDRMSDALALAEAATLMLLGPEGTRDVGSDSPLPLHRAVLHQAVGVLSVRLDVSVDEALARLRAYAFTHERPILEVADDVLNNGSSLENSSS